MLAASSAGLPLLTSIEGESAYLWPETVPTTVTAQVVGSPVGAVEVMARYGGMGAFTPVTMTDLGGGSYSALLPAPDCGDTPELYFQFMDATCGLVTDPAGAPAVIYSAEVGTLNPFFTDDFETDMGWTLLNLGATTGDWDRGIPVNDPGWAYDPAADFNGSGNAYLTENAIGNTDVDGGSTQLTSPVIDRTGGDVVIGYAYYLRLTNDGGVDRLLVEIDENGGAGPWTEIVRHDTDGGSTWRTHAISSTDLTAAGVTATTTMVLRFTVNDDGTASIVEAGVDAFDVTSPAYAPGQILAGATWKFQAWFRDSLAGAGQFDLSDGLSITFTP